METHKKRGRPPIVPYDEPKVPAKTPLGQAMEQATPCDYIRFQSPVAPGVNTEPVYEFRLEAKDKKYVVDQISHDSHTVYWKFQGRIQETPWVNVQLARPIQ
jgi:hypothetical protein